MKLSPFLKCLLLVSTTLSFSYKSSFSSDNSLKKRIDSIRKVLNKDYHKVFNLNKDSVEIASSFITQIMHNNIKLYELKNAFSILENNYNIIDNKENLETGQNQTHCPCCSN